MGLLRIWALMVVCVLIGFVFGFKFGEIKGYSGGRMDGDYIHRQEKCL